MNNLKIITIGLIIFFSCLLYVIFGEMYHSNTAKRVNVTVECTYIDGYIDTLTFKVPYDYHLQILSGYNYYLAYIQTDSPPFTGTHWKTLEEGVLRFKIIKEYETNTINK